MQKLRTNKFSIILPVLNEEKNIEKLIFLISKYLKGYIFEIIFIDDNSSDKTREVIQKYISKKIKYILRTSNHDLTLSCFLGIQKSKYKNIIIMDSDLQHDPKYLPKIVNLYFLKVPSVLSVGVVGVDDVDLTFLETAKMGFNNYLK